MSTAKNKTKMSGAKIVTNWKGSFHSVAAGAIAAYHGMVNNFSQPNETAAIRHAVLLVAWLIRNDTKLYRKILSDMNGVNDEN